VSDPAELALVVKAIMSGLGGCVEWKREVFDRVQEELAKSLLTPRQVRDIVIQHVRLGGEVIQVLEEREPWNLERTYWYKIIVPVPGVFPKGLFVECVLADADPDLPEIEFVNAHQQL
jgi:hypothetical protein